MQHLRAFVLIFGFVVFTLPLMPVQLLLRAVNTEWARRFPNWYHRQVSRLLGVTIHIRGRVSSDRPVLLVSNHISWLDIPVLSAVAPVAFVAKSEVATWPFISWLAKLQNSIFVERSRPRTVHASAGEIVARLKSGGNVVIFAEGTSSDGNQVLPFKSSLFATVKPRGDDAREIEESVDIQALAIGYTHQYGIPLCRKGRPIVAWYGDMEIAGHAWSLLKRGPLDVHVHISEPVRLSGFADRKALATYTEHQVREAVANILAPRRGRRAPQVHDKPDPR